MEGKPPVKFLQYDRYDDGDLEDMNLNEMRKALVAMPTHPGLEAWLSKRKKSRY
jgi:hypothetical protein